MSKFKTKAFKLRHFYYSKTLSNLINKTFKLIKLTKRILYFFKDCSERTNLVVFGDLGRISIKQKFAYGGL